MVLLVNILQPIFFYIGGISAGQKYSGIRRKRGQIWAYIFWIATHLKFFFHFNRRIYNSLPYVEKVHHVLIISR